MNLNSFYSKIIHKYQNGEYTVKYINEIDKLIISEKEFALYAIDYLIYEYCIANIDNRIPQLFDFILIPNITNPEKFTGLFIGYDFDEFTSFMTNIKNYKIEQIKDI